MATELQQQRLRLDMGLDRDDDESLTSDDIDLIFDEAGETYTDAASIHAAARVIALDRLLMQAANEVDYTQNNSSEKASQRYTQLSRERAKWQARLNDAKRAAGGGAARFGRTTKRPARIREYPGV